MAKKTVRRSISMTPEMRDLLSQLAAKQGREIREVDLIREAIRQYLDDQAEVVGSRRHFQRTLQTRLDKLEAVLTFHLHILIYLLVSTPDIDEAIIAAKRDGKALLKRIGAVRDLEDAS